MLYNAVNFLPTYPVVPENRKHILGCEIIHERQILSNFKMHTDLTRIKKSMAQHNILLLKREFRVYKIVYGLLKFSLNFVYFQVIKKSG